MADLKKYVLFLNGKKIYTKKLKAADQGATFHHTIENDFVPDGLPKAQVTEFDIKVGEAPTPVNVPPVINVKNAISVLVGTAVTIAATITDTDGSIATIDWKQISTTPTIPFSIAVDKKSIAFTTEPTAATYIFEVTAVDDKGASTSKQVTVTATAEPIPEPEPTGDLVIGVAGDTQDGSAADNTFSKIAAEKVDAFLFTGDTSYDDNDATGWTALIDKNGLKEEIILTQGNHEHAEESAEEAQADIEAWMPSLKEAPEVNPNEQSWEKTTWLTAKQVKNAYIISLNTQDTDKNFQRNQYNWVNKQLLTASHLKQNGKIDWIFVIVHMAWYTLKSNHAPEVAMRNVYQPLFEQYQVDFVFSGHNHNLQNWLPMTTNAQQLFTKTTDGIFDFTQPHGQFYIVSGAGGRNHYSFSENPSANPNVFFANDTQYGYHVIYISGKNATVQTKNASGTVLNTFKVTKGSVIEPEPCPAGQHRDPATGLCVPDTTPPPAGEFDEHGTLLLTTKIGAKTTGNKVAMEVGSNHRNGQRYNVNHHWVNYMGLGYIKTSPDENKQSCKLDGPNHGSCGQLPQCCWMDTEINLDTGRAALGAEYPHPDNHDAPAPSAKNLGINLKDKWIGWGTINYTNKDGWREHYLFCNPTPFLPDGKPNNATWVEMMHEIDTGQITTSELAKRDIPINFDEGLEYELRCQNAGGGGHGDTTDMKWFYVWEITPPTP